MKTICYTGDQPSVASTQFKPSTLTSPTPIAANSSQSQAPAIVHTKCPNLIPIFQVSYRSEYVSSLLDPARNNTSANTLDSLLWLTAASRDGDTRAQFTLAYLIHHGRHVQQDPARAFEYRLRAANGGHIEAMVYMARSLFNGDGVAKNEREGVRWMHLAAMKGHPIAMFELGMCFHYGRGVVINPSRALMWYIYSAEGGCHRAMSQIGVFYSEGIGIKANSREAVTWFERASKGGDSFGLYNLSVARRNGWGIAKDPRIAFGVCTRGASTEEACRDACYLLGRYFQGGEGVNVDLEQAKAWYWKAMVKGHEDARRRLESLVSSSEEIISEPAPLPIFEDWELCLEFISAESSVISSNSYEASHSSLESSPDMMGLTLSTS